TNIAARVHIGQDGTITVMTGKVECGQGSRAEITQAAAEELRVAIDRVKLLMDGTGNCPNDGTTAGSGTTPRTIPAIRQGTAAARNLLVEIACQQLNADPASVEVKDGKVIQTATGKQFSYADLARADDAAKAFAQAVPANVTVTSIKEWKVLGQPALRPNARELVIGAHHFPSDTIRPGMV